MDKPLNTSGTFSQKEQGKDNEKKAETTALNPEFAGLDNLNPQAIANHIKELKAADVPLAHSLLLTELLTKFEPLDFKLLTYPQVKRIRARLKKLGAIRDAEMHTEELESEITSTVNDETPNNEEIFAELKKLKKLKLDNKKYIVLAVENVIKVAKSNNWGLCKNLDYVYIYNGTHWAEQEKNTFQKFLGRAAEIMGVPELTARYYKFIDELYRQFITTAYLPAPEADTNKVLINLLNGTFEITADNTILRPFNQDDFLTYQLPFKYNPEADAPIFREYLTTVLPDMERQNVLAEYLGYIFIKNGNNTLKEEKVLLLYGTGANGKSVFFEIVNALLGSENISNYSLQSITSDSAYYRAKLANKLVNYASEINGKHDAGIFKQMASGEAIEARLPYGQPHILYQYAKLIFNCNELPKDTEQTNAFFRRFLIIPFDVTIPEPKQDKNLHTKIIESELSGVFNWVLEGLNRLLSQKRFSDCEAAQKAVERYRTESDSVKMFINENQYEKSTDDYELTKDLYNKYKIFCSEDGYRPVSKVNFGKRLTGFGIEVKRLGIGMVVYLTNNTEL